MSKTTQISNQPNTSAVNVLDFIPSNLWAGIKDGTNTTALQTYINAAFTASPQVHFPLGTYKITGRIDAVDSDNIQITADRGTIIDATGVTDYFVFWVSGQAMPASEAVQNLYDRTLRTGGQALGADATEGDITLNIPAALGLAKGDIIRLSSSDLFTSSYATAYSGELCEVYSVSGTTVTLTKPIADGYTAANTTVFKLVMPKVSVSNITILGNSIDQIGLSVWEARDVDVNNVEVKHCKGELIRLTYCYGGELHNCSGSDNYDGSSNQYGISVASSQSIEVHSNRFEGGRHAISCGGYEPTRYCDIHSNTFSVVTGQGVGALDLHSNTQHIMIHDNTVHGGIYASGADVKCHNNIVHQYPSTLNNGNYGICLYIHRSCNYTDVLDNTIISHGDGASTLGTSAFGKLWVLFEVASCTVDNVTIKGNYLKGAVGFAHGNLHIRPSAVSITGSVITTLRIENNHTEVTAATGVSRCIAVDDGGVGVAAMPTVTRAYINNNYISETSGNGRAFAYSVDTASEYLEFNNNHVIWSLSSLDIPSAYYPARVSMMGNYIKRSSAGAGGLLRLYGSNNTSFIFNTLENVTSSTYYDIQNAALAETYGNTLINCTGGSGNVVATTHVTAVPAL